MAVIKASALLKYMTSKDKPKAYDTSKMMIFHLKLKYKTWCVCISSTDHSCNVQPLFYPPSQVL